MICRDDEGVGGGREGVVGEKVAKVESIGRGKLETQGIRLTRHELFLTYKTDVLCWSLK